MEPLREKVSLRSALKSIVIAYSILPEDHSLPRENQHNFQINLAIAAIIILQSVVKDVGK